MRALKIPLVSCWVGWRPVPPRTAGAARRLPCRPAAGARHSTRPPPPMHGRGPALDVREIALRFRAGRRPARCARDQRPRRKYRAQTRPRAGWVRHRAGRRPAVGWRGQRRQVPGLAADAVKGRPTRSRTSAAPKSTASLRSLLVSAGSQPTPDAAKGRGVTRRGAAVSGPRPSP